MSARGAAARVEVRQVRSGIGFSQKQKSTLKALGLGRIGKSRQLPDNAEIRGMVACVCHLVELREVGK